MSRKVTAHLFSSVNGVVESPNRWQFDAFGPEEGQMMGEVIGAVTDVVIGRRLWQEWGRPTGRRFTSRRARRDAAPSDARSRRPRWSCPC